MKLFFYRNIEEDNQQLRQQILDEQTGFHKFFRLSGPKMQTRFTEIVCCSDTPSLLIHGNPHVANYCKTSRGAAMVDFDRSRVGPYSYDIVRFLTSMSIVSNDDDYDFLHPVVLDHFRRGYMFGLLNRKYEHIEMHDLRTKEPRKWQVSATDYLDSGKKWAKKLFNNKVNPSKKRLLMLESYYESLDGKFDLSNYKLSTCSEVGGSMGKIHYLYLLESNNNKDEPIIIDIKEVYEEEDNEYFTNPFNHHGIRMNEAGSVYAPGWEQMPGHATHKNEQFWCRKIPIQQFKLALDIDSLDQCDLCFSVASQLGRGHRRAGTDFKAKDIFEDFKLKFDEYVDCAKQIKLELVDAYEVYSAMATLLKHGYK